jgi:hypothetical protein
VETSQSGGEKNLAALARFFQIWRKVKKVCPFTNLASRTDPLKGQLFAKKGVK